MAWDLWGSLANNLIHKFCAEVHKSPAIALKVVLWITISGLPAPPWHACHIFTQNNKSD
jgi:hypothetical protein